ncbi:MAG: glycosyltransferase family 2 protein, partial [Phycisphaerales bacterium]|nr:glycosyltransferase family 2 protein [Phycisphaerales bacterium]
RANGGPAAARNMGVAQARCPWITFLDSDDYYLPTKLESQCRALGDYPQARVLVSNGYILEGPDEDADKRDNFSYGKLDAQSVRRAAAGELTPHLCADLAGYVEGLLFDKAVWEELGGMDESIWGIEDLDFYMRLSLAEEIVLLAEPGYVKDYDMQVDQRITSDHGCDPGFFAYYIRICQKALKAYPDMPAEASAALRSRAQDWARPLLEYHVRSGDRRAAASVRRRALALGPNRKLSRMVLFTLPIVGRLLHSVVRGGGGELAQRSPRVSCAMWEAASV